MPSPHFDIKTTQRSKGQSFVAGAAYQSGEKLFSEYEQKYKNYTRKDGIVYTEIMFLANAPPKYADRGTLWNLREAAIKIADDFGISYDNRRKVSIRPRIREPTSEQLWGC